MHSHEYLSSLLDYYPDTGVFVWKKGRNIGQVAGYRTPKGYVLIDIGRRRPDRKTYKAHQLAWFLHYHEWPPSQIDHFPDPTKWNNQISNLRLATQAENLKNRGKRIHNTSGYKGVCFVKDNKKRPWRASIGTTTPEGKRKRIDLGYFASPIEAARSYNEGALKYHGEFANLNVL